MILDRVALIFVTILNSGSALSTFLQCIFPPESILLLLIINCRRIYVSSDLENWKQMQRQLVGNKKISRATIFVENSFLFWCFCWMTACVNSARVKVNITCLSFHWHSFCVQFIETINVASYELNIHLLKQSTIIGFLEGNTSVFAIRFIFVFSCCFL